MKPVTFSPHARQLLADIESYTRRRWGAHQADLYISTLIDSVFEAINDPVLRPRSASVILSHKAAVEFCFIGSGQHVLIYRLSDANAEVIAIFHVRQDFERGFAELLSGGDGTI